MAKLEEKHYKYLNNPDFYNNYLQSLYVRLIYSNNIIEEDNGPIEKLFDNANISALNDNTIAFNILLNELNTKEERPLTQTLIINVANTINKHCKYISNGYRTIEDNHKLDDIYPISNPKDIEEDMKKLLNDYYVTWKDKDLFEREALFNIEFLRIHPFEDGNGRTSRLILNFNIMRNGHAPVLIPEKLRKDYFYARDTENVEWIKNMFEELSQKELEAIEKLIEDYKNDNEIPEDELGYK